MSVQSKRITEQYHFRYFGKGYNRKVGLYLCNVWLTNGRYVRISEPNINAMIEWLGLYKNQYLTKKATTSFAETKSKARAVVKAIDLLESHVGEK